MICQWCGKNKIIGNRKKKYCSDSCAQNSNLYKTNMYNAKKAKLKKNGINII